MNTPAIFALLFTLATSSLRASEAPAPAAWKYSIAGVGNILFNAGDAPEGITGTFDEIEIRRSFVDIKMEHRDDKGIVLGAKMRVWLEPVFYANDPYYRPGFGKNDTRLPLELFNEIEASVGSIPLDSKKMHLLTLTAGKGYVAFGFDRPEEQTGFEEFPLIHPVTKANGLGQEPHARVTYTNKALGMAVDGELFQVNLHDSNLMDIDLPSGEGLSWAVRVRKNLPFQIEALGSYADVKNTDGTTSDHFAVGIKKTQPLGQGRSLVLTVENSGIIQHMPNGKARNTTAWHAELGFLMKKDTVRIRYGRIVNPARPAPVNEFTANYTRLMYQSQGGRRALSLVGEASRTAGAMNPSKQPLTRTDNRVTGGIRFSFK